MRSTYCEDDDSSTLVDSGANGFSNTSPSDIALGTLSATVSVIGIFGDCEDEFVGVGANSSTVVDAFGV
ncbi:hypothetical protein Tco_0385579 [Tanacetum coccineum]